MQLVRNLHPDGLGKYKVVNNVTGKVLQSTPGSADEFFVIKLSDPNAEAALRAYANSVRGRDAQFAAEVDDLADRAGKNSPFCKEPD